MSMELFSNDRIKASQSKVWSWSLPEFLSITGPWTHRGVINTTIPNSSTNHQAVVEYKGNWYFIYHSAGLPTGGTYRRSVCIDKLEYDDNGLIKPIVRTSTSVPAIGPISVINESMIHKQPVIFFPNPSSDGNIKIDLQEWSLSDSPLNIILYNNAGSKVYYATNLGETVDLYLARGFYILKADIGNSLLSEKIIVY